MNDVLLKRIDELCNEKDISRRKLQETLGLSSSTITKWKTSTPSATTLQAVADYFNVTTDYLTGRTEYRNKDHMLQCFDGTHKPDLTKTEIPESAYETNEGIVTPKYIDPETRILAERIMNDDQLKRIMAYLEHASKGKVDAIDNMIKAMDAE